MIMLGDIVKRIDTEGFVYGQIVAHNTFDSGYFLVVGITVPKRRDSDFFICKIYSYGGRTSFISSKSLELVSRLE